MRTTPPGAPADPSSQDDGGTGRITGRVTGGATLPERADADVLLAGLLLAPGRATRCVHVATVPARRARTAPWPDWVHPEVRSELAAQGIDQLWAHQADAASLAHHGRHVVLATGTASGKSVGFLLPALTAVAEGAGYPTGRGATVLYLSPTKALAHDQLRALESLRLPGLRAAAYDGDTPTEERAWVRAHASYLLTNPDMLHRSMLPRHSAWSSFLRALRYVVVDESHVYRGVFGSHMAAVLRRLLRVARSYGAEPVVVCATATSGDPAAGASRLVGAPVVAVQDDASPRGPVRVAFWQPALTSHVGENGAPVRRTATAETAELLTDLVVAGARSLAFVRSRRGAETVASTCRDRLDEAAPELAGAVAAYRAGFLPEERRELETHLREGRLRGVAATTALELGIDVHGLDAVLVAGWPGRLSSWWQQVGRAGRDGRAALAVLVARDDPLDTYLVQHPEAVLGARVEATVFDPDNAAVLRGHLQAAAAELPLRPDDLAAFGPRAPALVDELTAAGRLRRRPTGWYWTRPERATDLVDLRGSGEGQVRVVEVGTGRLLGTVDAGAAHSAVHEGAVYVHQGITHVVSRLDLDAAVAFATPALVDHSTHARARSELRLLRTDRTRSWGQASLAVGDVEVTSQVVSFLRRRHLTGEVLGETPLDLPPRTLTTRGMWWTMTPELLAAAGLRDTDVPGAAHAAEHAAIGLLPLVASCDPGDVGGISTALHPDTGAATVVVHDGQEGGGGFAERGFDLARTWLTATLDAVAACRCPYGCPSCVQSPACGDGNEPLDKAGAIRLLTAVLTDADADDGDTD